MRSGTYASHIGAAVLLATAVVEASHGVHEHLEALHHRHHRHRDNARSRIEQPEHEIKNREASDELLAVVAPVTKRDGQCAFPYSDGLIPVTPGDQNAGWAMSPNQPCTPGTYCPYACPPGQVSMQWDPAATSYSYPVSMHGGAYCDENGNINKPFPDKPWCQQTQSMLGVQNNAGSVVSFCQTVLPGNEAMLIPTSVESWAELAVPDMSYWCGTAAHYYINSPGITTDIACVWGTNQNPWGNWAPYVGGANIDENGMMFMKLGWNPIWLEPATPFRTTMPNWGVEIQCNGGGCVGLPCSIDPSQNGVNEMVGSSTIGAGGAAFCVVTVPAGSSASYVITGPGGSSSSPAWSSSSSSAPPSSSWSAPAPAWSAPPSQSWNGQQGAAGGFYQSSTESTTSTTGWNTSWSAWSSTTASSNTSSWYSHAPTHSPYFSLFNHTHTPTATNVPTTSVVAAKTTAYSSSSFVAPSALPKTGTGSMITASTGLPLVILLMAAVVFY